MSEVMAFGQRTNNAQLMVDCRDLGYFRDLDIVFDPTYGEGRFWKLWRPERLMCSDLYVQADMLPHGLVNPWDFTNFPLPDRTANVTVFDPPYKLNGTPEKGGPATSDKGYGVGGTAVRWQDRHELIRSGITECARVTERILMIKCMDQVCSGQVRWQTREFADLAESRGFSLIDMLHVQGYRKQPEGRRQLHARRDYSTLLVLERK
jgi:hypothetical protein